MKLRNVVIGLFVVGVVAGMVWFARGVKESRWRSEQGLHIRWNVDWFSNQYERISKLGDEDLRHDYVTNFTCHACTLLNLACKTAPNTSNLVERYYRDWDERIEKAECKGRKDSAAIDFSRRYGFAANVLFVNEDVNAGTLLTKDKLCFRDYVSSGVGDRFIRIEDMKSVLGRKVAFDLKRGSILLRTDLCKETKDCK